MTILLKFNEKVFIIFEAFELKLSQLISSQNNQINLVHL